MIWCSERKFALCFLQKRECAPFAEQPALRGAFLIPFLVYFEKGYPQTEFSEIRGARLNSFYQAQWFNPRNGSWMNAGNGELAASNTGIIHFPLLPDHMDWGLRLIYKGPNNANKILPFIPPAESRIKKYLRKIWPGMEENHLKKIMVQIIGGVFILLLAARLLFFWRRP